MSSRPGRTLLRFALYACGFVAAGLARWIRLNFGEPSVDQVLYHLEYAEGAAVQMSGIFLVTFLAEVLAFPLLFAAGATALHGRIAARHGGWPRYALRSVAGAAVAAGLTLLLLQFSAFSYAAAQFGPDRFAERHVPAAGVPLEASAPRRNLVVIYVESLEEAYGDAALFGRDLLAPLRQLGGSAPGVLRQAPGANWTIAGMVASQCGVPLQVYSQHDVAPRGDARIFLPGAVCLGDVLAARGWHNVFLGGAPLSFAGKGRFLRDHGYAEAWGRDEWQREGVRDEELNEWGLYDAALFRRARARLAQLHAAGRPFHMSVLTLDMHNPRGFLSPECRRRGARDFAGIVECTAAEVADFVRFARERGYLRDTTIVILGDHLAVPNPVYAQLRQAGERRIFSLVVADPLPRFAGRALHAFDLYPTLLELAGLQVDGGRLGLGRTALGTDAGGQHAEPLPLASLRGSRAYRALWETSVVAPPATGAASD